MAIFRTSGEKHGLAIAMTGIKLGDRLLFVGCTDASLLTAIASKVGLSGRAAALVSTDSDGARARKGAEHGGVLLELETSGGLESFPFENDSFNLVLVDNQEGLISTMPPEQRVRTLQQVYRVLAPRGRVVVVERGPKSGLGALFKTAPEPNPHYASTGGAAAALQAEGFKAVRLLAEREGLSFFEGVR